jgi:hypothetical protein
MKKYIIFLFISLLFLGCYSNKRNSNNKGLTHKNMTTIEIPLLRIKNVILYPVLDSVIKIKKRCLHFNNSTCFGFVFNKQDSTYCFDSYVEYKDALNLLPPQGYLEINGHIFFSLFFYNGWFEKTGEVKKFTYERDTVIPYVDDDATIFKITKACFILKREEKCE